MKIFVPANNKGGVGKTATSVLFAEYATKQLKMRVLGIDLDPQCNFSQRYLSMEVDPSSPEGLMPPIHPDFDPTNLDPLDSEWDGRSSIADIFYGKPIFPYPTYIENLDIAPACGDRLLAAESVRRAELAEKVHKRMQEFLRLPEVEQQYDLAIIDTAPSKGPLTISAIRASTHVIIPTVMEDKPIQGVYGMLQLWMQESFQRPKDLPIELVGILPNMFDQRTTLHNQMYSSLLANKEIGKYVFPDDLKLSKRVVFAETDCTGASPRSIFDFPENNLARKEAVAVCEYITKRIFS